MLKGIDVSSYQPGAYSTTGLDFVFIKVTEGLTYVNPRWVAQRGTARAAGLVTGFYHYPHIANSPQSEANHFLSQIKLEPGDILCLDWEWYGQTVSDQQARDYKDTFISYLRDKAPGHRIVTYSDVNNWTHIDRNSNCGDGLWIATGGRPAGQPGIQHPWTFHQYTDKPVDMDVANFPTAQALRDWAHGTTASTQETDMPLTDDDAHKVALAVLTYKNPDAAKANPSLPDVYGFIAGTAHLTAQIGALSGAVAELTKAVGAAGGITAEQVQAAAEAGATAALDKLGHSLTGQ